MAKEQKPQDLRCVMHYDSLWHVLLLKL